MLKLTRPGNTETTVMFCRHLLKSKKYDNSIDKIMITDLENQFINWLYSSTGFYDKTIGGTYFDIDTESVKNSDVYNQFLNMCQQSIHKATYWHIFIHGFLLKEPYKTILTNFAIENEVVCSTNLINIYKSELDQYKDYWCIYTPILPLLDNKRVLIINGFSDLMLDQYFSGNLKKIYPSMSTIKNMIGIKTPFTFFNNGSHDNYLTDIKIMKEQIDSLLGSFDIAFVGCGPMGCILTDYIHSFNIDAIHMGSGIQKLFGIDSGGKPKDYWITEIPEHLIPNNANKIENGRYWYGG
jgi:hypothetical protein